MMIWGNVVRAQQADAVQEESADLVPKSWQLCRRSSTGQTKVLAGAALAYDVNDEGRIVFTNGNAIFLLEPDGRKELVLNESMIEQVFFMPG